MTERAERAELVVGAAVLAIAAGFLAWSVGGWGERGQGTYPLVASFPNVDGVERGTEVRLAGVRVGRVSDVRLNPDTYYAEAELRVPESIVLPTDSAALIQSDGLLGGSYIELRPGGAVETLGPGDEIEDVQGAVSLLGLMMKFVDSQAGGDDAAEDQP
ncbi:outer membrane lipid asymmetry maintenance protein MlaD [Paracoccus salipaludis]|uniref:Outer membrane lipid asymmetry maintenance protein MlaD n=1 Tax=Paracoccus salipaludis TaxID=2032623 RepID=A0A2A2GP57_9RHOB|nr:outer membrane lipid asymmetry maintenance protein MlaD [Paracoccus salipaludis]PAU99020.1 outer membrane lipid asymmetry maintenance protein MlaD [Paracoccus salipaludis]